MNHTNYNRALPTVIPSSLRIARSTVEVKHVCKQPEFVPFTVCIFFLDTLR